MQGKPCINFCEPAFTLKKENVSFNNYIAIVWNNFEHYQGQIQDLEWPEATAMGR